MNMFNKINLKISLILIMSFSVIVSPQAYYHLDSSNSNKTTVSETKNLKKKVKKKVTNQCVKEVENKKKITLKKATDEFNVLMKLARSKKTKDQEALLNLLNQVENKHNIKSGIKALNDQLKADKKRIQETAANGLVECKTKNSIIKESSTFLTPITSEIDKYGVDLYQLKQGETIFEKAIPTKIKIAYIRNGNEIDRVLKEIIEVIQPAKNIGIVGFIDMIDLDAQKNFIASIKETETEIEIDCEDGSKKHCANGKERLDYLKTKCLSFKENEKITACLVDGFKNALKRPTKASQEKFLGEGVYLGKLLMDIAIVGQPYKNNVGVVATKEGSKIASLFIANPTVGGAKPVIDNSGVVTWVANNNDFIRTRELLITAKLESGANVILKTPVDVRKERLLTRVKLGEDEASYSDQEGRYLIRIKRLDPKQPIVGTLEIVEKFKVSGYFVPEYRIVNENNTDLIVIDQPVSVDF